MRRIALLLASLAACTTPVLSSNYACDVTADCESGRVCDRGYCVVAPSNEPDASPQLPPDAPPPPPDADPFVAIAMQCQAAGYTQVSATGGYYRVVATSSSWLNAETDCANDVPGASHLIVLSSAAEVTYMQAQLGWVGLTDRAVEGTFANVTGEAGDLRPWLSGQPDNGGGSEDCAQMKAGGLDDDQCGNGHRYVCECDGRAPIP